MGSWMRIKEAFTRSLWENSCHLTRLAAASWKTNSKSVTQVLEQLSGFVQKRRQVLWARLMTDGPMRVDTCSVARWVSALLGGKWRLCSLCQRQNASSEAVKESKVGDDGGGLWHVWGTFNAEVDTTLSSRHRNEADALFYLLVSSLVFCIENIVNGNCRVADVLYPARTDKFSTSSVPRRFINIIKGTLCCAWVPSGIEAPCAHMYHI